MGECGCEGEGERCRAKKRHGVVSTCEVWTATRKMSKADDTHVPEAWRVLGVRSMQEALEEKASEQKASEQKASDDKEQLAAKEAVRRRAGQKLLYFIKESTTTPDELRKYLKAAPPHVINYVNDSGARHSGAAAGARCRTSPKS